MPLAHRSIRRFTSSMSISGTIGTVAELEKDIIRERIKAGLENTKRKGRYISLDDLWF